MEPKLERVPVRVPVPGVGLGLGLGVERVPVPGKGLGLRAASSVPTGGLLLSSEPLAFCVSSRRSGSSGAACHHCCSRSENLLRCSACKLVRYCNPTCQRLSWSSVHHTECKCLRAVRPKVPTDSVRLAARVLMALVNPSRSSSEELYTVEELLSHVGSMSEKKKDGVSHLAAMLELYLQGEPRLLQEVTSLPPSCREPFSLIAKVMCNCFTISDGELQEIGVGLYPSLSLLNHDCRPNCVMVFVGTELQLRAVRHIQAEEELTISYVESLSVSADRRRQLDEQYHFTCCCLTCLSPEQDKLMMSGPESSWTLLKDSLSTLERLRAESNWTCLFTECVRLLAAVGDVVPDVNVYKLKVMDAAVDAAINLELWQEAVTYAERTLPVYSRYFPDPHPVHGVQLLRVGKLQHHLELLEKALDSFTQAYQRLKVTHGPDHPLTSDLLMKLEECRMELDQRSSSSH